MSLFYQSFAILLLTSRCKRETVDYGLLRLWTVLSIKTRTRYKIQTTNHGLVIKQSEFKGRLPYSETHKTMNA